MSKKNGEKEKMKNSQKCENCIHYEVCDKQKITNHTISKSVCKHYKDKSLFVELPCKVGDTVYIVENPYTYLPLKKVVDGEVVSIHWHEHGLYLRVLFDTKKINGCRDYNLDWCLDKSIFLTKEEAEKKLQEMG